MRSGTLPTHQIVGMGKAFSIAEKLMEEENRRIRQLRDDLWGGLSKIEAVYLNGDLNHRVPHNLNVSFNFVEGESLEFKAFSMFWACDMWNLNGRCSKSSKTRTSKRG